MEYLRQFTVFSESFGHTISAKHRKNGTTCIFYRNSAN